MASPKISLKLLVDKKASRVLFAEAPKEFVDFLFHIFSLPLGTLIELLGSNQMVGCLGKLKDSIQSFHQNYLQPGIKIENVFNPKTAFNGDTFLLSYDASSDDQSGASRAFYVCPNFKKFYGQTCQGNATLHKSIICPDCNCPMNAEKELVLPTEEAKTKKADNKGKGGYVKEVVTYMVMDNLVVKPMSTISSITLLNRLYVKDMSQLEEKMVSFGKDEGLKLLAASLRTDKVLTQIFMH